MNILILDKDELTWQGIEYFKEFKEKWKFFSYSSMEKKGYTFADFDLVIVDIADCKNKKLYNDILDFDKKKKIIVLSETLEKCNQNDCTQCELNNQVRRLMKPLELGRLYNLINFFESKCDFFNAFENITNLIESVVKRYSSLIYNTSTKEVITNMKAPSSLYTHELLSFVNILEQNNVKYTIINENKIKID